MKERCQRYQRGTLIRMRVFSFFGLNTSSSITRFLEGRTGERELSTVPTLCPEQDASIFVFRSKQFIFYISISGFRSGERKLSAVLYAVP